MARLLATRLASLVAVLLVVSILVFLLGSLIPGDLTSVIVGQEGATAAQFATVRHQLGLDQPLPLQYLHWLGNALSGDFGTSPITGRSVSSDLTQQIPVSAELAMWCLLFSTLIGVPAGIMAACWWCSPFRRS
jgi:peptide/nickel transport system permease protein